MTGFPAPPPATHADVLIVGGGLAGSLIALAIAARDASRRVIIVDAGTPAPDQSGSHTWSFHDTDLSPDAARWIAPAIAHRWPGQEVRFPAFARRLRAGYASLTTQSLRAAVQALPMVTLCPGRAAAIGAAGAELQDGTRLNAPCVIDATGRVPRGYLALGWQKFVGVEIRTPRPHGRALPIIMDATVDQRDGYRFVYTLPFAPDRILIEDTRYSDGPALDHASFAAGIGDYARAQGWDGTEMRREHGVLPIAMAFDAEALWNDAAGGPVLAGMRAGLFHPVTGYSLPLAARAADTIAAALLDAPASTARVMAAMRRFALDTAARQGFLRLLSRMLFMGAAPAARRKVLERFYRLPEPLIERFYAGDLTRADQARILIGRPPIRVRDALPCLREAPLIDDLRRKRTT